MANEKALLGRWFQHMREARCAVYVTYNGDFFDWPFMETRATACGMDMKAELGFACSKKGGECLSRCFLQPAHRALKVEGLMLHFPRKLTGTRLHVELGSCALTLLANWGWMHAFGPAAWELLGGAGCGGSGIRDWAWQLGLLAAEWQMQVQVGKPIASMHFRLIQPDPGRSDMRGAGHQCTACTEAASTACKAPSQE